MDIGIDKGPLAVCSQSHLFINMDEMQTNDEKMDDELPPLFDARKDGIWKSTSFDKGDLLIFDIRTVHASLSNQTGQYRVSMDTRWQPKNAVRLWGDAYVEFDEPMDCSMSDSDADDSDNEVVETLDFEHISQRDTMSRLLESMNNRTTNDERIGNDENK